jgi:hypothetical protein
LKKKTVVLTTVGRSGCGYEDNIKRDPIRGVKGWTVLNGLRKGSTGHDIEKAE